MVKAGSIWRTVSLVLFALSAMLFVAGMGLTTTFAPCYQPGAMVTEVALALTPLSVVAFLIAALKGQSGWAWVVCSAIGTCFMLFVGYLWTVLLCRGV